MAREDDEALKAAEVDMLEMPRVLDPHNPENVIKASEESFEDVCTVMQENGVVNPKDLTEFEFYSKLRYYEKKHSKNGGSK